MRVHKFRVWDKINRKWVNACNFYLDNMQRIFAVVDTDGEMYGLHQVEMMQYTGLLDKNGKEIYEGDIVRLNGVLVDGDEYICEAIMNGWQSVFESRRGAHKGFYCPMGSTAQNYRQVIGNIYENPELIGGQ